MEELRQEFKVSDSAYQASGPHPSKYLLCAITDPIKLLIRHLQYHPSLPVAPLNHLDPEERAAVTATTHRDSTNEFTPRLLIYTASSTVPRIFPLEPHPIPYSVPHNIPSRCYVL